MSLPDATLEQNSRETLLMPENLTVSNKASAVSDGDAFGSQYIGMALLLVTIFGWGVSIGR